MEPYIVILLCRNFEKKKMNQAFYVSLPALQRIACEIVWKREQDKDPEIRWNGVLSRHSFQRATYIHSQNELLLKIESSKLCLFSFLLFEWFWYVEHKPIPTVDKSVNPQIVQDVILVKSLLYLGNTCNQVPVNHLDVRDDETCS